MLSEFSINDPLYPFGSHLYVVSLSLFWEYGMFYLCKTHHNCKTDETHRAFLLYSLLLVFSHEEDICKLFYCSWICSDVIAAEYPIFPRGLSHRSLIRFGGKYCSIYCCLSRSFFVMCIRIIAYDFIFGMCNPSRCTVWMVEFEVDVSSCETWFTVHRCPEHLMRGDYLIQPGMPANCLFVYLFCREKYSDLIEFT